MAPSDPIVSAVATCGAFRDLSARLPGPGGRAVLGGVRGSAASAVLAALERAHPGRVFVALVPAPAEAAALEADLDTFFGDSGPARLYPQKEALPYEEAEPHLEIGGLRVEAVEALFSGRAHILVTTPRALQERAPIPGHLALLRLSVRVGDTTSLPSLAAALEERGFERVPLVEEVGQFAVRGGLVDVFSVGAGDPVRIELWGDEVASIRAFDVLDQRSTRELTETHVLPVDFRRGADDTETVSRSLLELLPGDAVVTVVGGANAGADAGRTWERVEALYIDLVDSGAAPPPPSSLFLSPDELEGHLRRLPLVELTAEVPQGGLDLATADPPAIDRDMGRLDAYLREGAARGRETLLLCDNDGQLQRLEEILGGAERIPAGTRLAIGALAAGFELPTATPPLRVLNDHEIFRRSRRLRRTRRFRGAVALESLAQLAPGDYVVHMDHGVGRFVGLERIEVAGEEIEALAIEYAGAEILRLPVYRLDLVERWVGESDDATPPQVHRIGGKRWKTLRRKTEKAIEEMTAELLHLYARRARAQGHGFGPDSRWQKEMESSFLYDDTPDQRAASEDVKRDMEAPRPMDRLVCGDVGYGKTEVAIRAAFKAVQDGKQVAVLAPTTILVEQHRHTFSERLADYPVTVAALSRFRSASETRALLGRVASGGVDIVIGTHRLLSSDVAFHDLGLLVVDEEQRFGVKHKERLKRMRTSVDVLTLTATPIPRTLYLSLSGIRDLSLIRTPPRDRMPIFTHVLPWTDQILLEALHRELDRGGQAFFLHNRVETIYTVAEEVRALVPDAKVAVAHGQMPPAELDEVMRAFVDGEVDVLVCSSIIENGLDVPNANTLIVDRADRFGLSQLYQIRGRVGRSDRRAYCYLLVPEELPEDADRRLKVLEHYTELGSGYSVALRDLELRGAGNLLGADQSGFAHQVGLDTYLRLLERTVERMQKGEDVDEYPDPDVALGGPAYLPEGYVEDAGQKLHLYRRLSRVRTPGEVEALGHEMADRFGPLPAEAKRLLEAATLRILGRAVGAERILVQDRAARLSFRAGVVPKVADLDGPLSARQVALEVRRIEPLSLILRQVGTLDLGETVTIALAALRTEERGES
ncbi:MAG: transcription-repair coupling factor [Gemmatimonadetes bacterium]|nr:transcription-repair coupling factor [Gemmatimonadota bacterium]